MPTTIKGVVGKLHEIQKEGIEGLTKDSKNPHFRNTYISLAKLLDTVLPILNSKGLVLIQTPNGLPSSGEWVPSLKTCIVDTETDETVEGEVPLMLEKSNPQGLGSAITYARRYALMSMLGLVADEDDDGAAASPVREIVNQKAAVEQRDPHDGGRTEKPLF